MDIYKSVKTSTETVMKNPEMLNFVADYLNTKKFAILINVRKWQNIKVCS